VLKAPETESERRVWVIQWIFTTTTLSAIWRMGEDSYMKTHVNKTVPIEFSQVKFLPKTEGDKTEEPIAVLSLANEVLNVFIKNNKSRMTGDCHVRFCERLRGESPLCLLGG
jgi:hypothetical protein